MASSFFSEIYMVYYEKIIGSGERKSLWCNEPVINYCKGTVSSNGRAVHRTKKPDQWNEDAESLHNPHCFFLFSRNLRGVL